MEIKKSFVNNQFDKKYSTMNAREIALMEHRRSNTSMRSISQHALLKELKVKPPDGLKKLATNFRNSVKTNKLDLEKYRGVFKDKRTVIDSRFRRERTKSPKRPNHSQSESRFQSKEIEPDSNKDKPKPKNNSAPTVNKLEVSEREIALEKRPPEAAARRDAKIETERLREAEKNDRATSMVGFREPKKNVMDFYETATELAVPINASAPNEDGDKNIEISNKLKNVGVLAIPPELRRKVDIMPKRSFIQLNCLNNTTNKDPYWEEYADYLQSATVKKSNSTMSLPMSTTHMISNSMYECTNPTNSKVPPLTSYTFDNATEVSTNVFVNREAFLRKHLTSYHLAVFYAIGCVCGLFIVALVAWVLSNELIWSWVNTRREQPKSSLGWLATSAALCSKVVLYTVNFILSSFLNVITLPRNAVFSTQEENPTTIWSYFNPQ